MARSKRSVAIPLLKALGLLTIGVIWVYTCGKFLAKVIPDDNFGAAIVFGIPVVLVLFVGFYVQKALGILLDNVVP
jgi:hypothetical protein